MHSDQTSLVRRGSTLRRFVSKPLLALALAFGLVGVGLAVAAQQEQPQKPRIEASKGQAIVKRLHALRPNLPIDSVTLSPVAGLLTVNLADGSTYYASEDGRYLLGGDLFRLDETELVNVTEQNRAQNRMALLAKIDKKDSVVFSPASATKASLYIFTDVDCGYCRKLHQEVPALNAKGIEVRYLAYPRAGVGSASYNKIVSAWCAADPQAALTALKSGQNITTQTCSNPVAEQYGLGQQMGINGTPAIVLQDGTLLPGYMPAEQLAIALGI